VSIREHTYRSSHLGMSSRMAEADRVAYVSIRQHTSAYGSIRQRMSSRMAEADAHIYHLCVTICTFVPVKQVLLYEYSKLGMSNRVAVAKVSLRPHILVA
jgi:hypothetical protein